MMLIEIIIITIASSVLFQTNIPCWQRRRQWFPPRIFFPRKHIFIIEKKKNKPWRFRRLWLNKILTWYGEKVGQITFSRIKVQYCGPFCDNSSLFFLLFNLRWAVAKLYVSLVLFSSFSFAFFNSGSSLSLFLSSGRCYHPPTQRYHWSRPARKSRMFSPVILFILVYCVWSCFILFK